MHCNWFFNHIYHKNQIIVNIKLIIQFIFDANSAYTPLQIFQLKILCVFKVLPGR